MVTRYKAMTNPYNSNKFRERALGSESFARKTPYDKNRSEYFEEAGDNWVRQAIASNKADSIDASNCLVHAREAYENATQTNEEEGRKRIEGKRNSIESKIKSSIKGRTNIGGKLALVVFSIVTLAFVFVSFSFTGYSIREIVAFDSGYIILGLFMIGIVLAVFYFKGKKKK